MKKVFPIALLLCLSLSFSGLSSASSRPSNAPVKQQSVKLWWAYETDGILTGAPGGDIAWHITYSGTTPVVITFSRSGVTYGPYQFVYQGGSVYLAGGPRTQLGIIQSWVNAGVASFTTVW